MSIFGAMKRASKVEQASDLQIKLDMMKLIVLNQINTIKSGLQDSVREVAINYDVLQNRIGSISDKIYLTFFVESKGAIMCGERFSFGNGRREDTGYVTMFPVCILGVGLSSARNSGDVTVALFVNNVEIPECIGVLSITTDLKRMTILIFHLR